MIRINLLPPEERPVTRSIKLPKSPAMLAVGFFLLLALPIAVTSINQATTRSGLQGAIVEAEAERTRLKPEIDRLHRLNKQTTELNHRIRVVTDLDKRSTYYVQVLDDLSQILPRHTWLTRIEEDQTRTQVATIEGYSFTNLQVADLMVRLEKLPHFENIVLVSIERKGIEGRDVLNFKVEVGLTYSTSQEDQVEHS